MNVYCTYSDLVFFGRPLQFSFSYLRTHLILLEIFISYVRFDDTAYAKICLNANMLRLLCSHSCALFSLTQQLQQNLYPNVLNERICLCIYVQKIEITEKYVCLTLQTNIFRSILLPNETKRESKNENNDQTYFA